MAVDGVSLTVAEGEIFGLIGPNGAAKTSTRECVEGVRTPRPSIERHWCSCSAILRGLDRDFPLGVSTMLPPGLFNSAQTSSTAEKDPADPSVPNTQLGPSVNRQRTYDEGRLV
jgi:energy-coupling factor transporter ATP-binding protein EcfA2